MSRRVGALDLGTNAVLCTVAELDERPDAELVILEEHETITRLGEGVDRTRTLSAAARARTLACLERYRAHLDALGVEVVFAVGTSALRDATHGAEFAAEAARVLGAPLEIVSGAREAELTFSGAISGLELGGPVFVFDIGGGSTELVWGHRAPSGEARIERARSLDLGSVRLFERLAPSDPPTPAEIKALRESIRRALLEAGDAPNELQARGAVIGVAGTVTSLVQLLDEECAPEDPAARRAPREREPEGTDRSQRAHGSSGAMSSSEAKEPSGARGTPVHGRRASLEEIRRVSEFLLSLPLTDRSRLPRLDPRRADVIVCGAILCEEILEWAGADSLLASDRGVRFGLLESWRRGLLEARNPIEARNPTRRER